MDDMIGVPEREDAIVIPIHSHPDYRCYTSPDIQIGEDNQQDPVDAEMIAILEEAGAAQALEEQNAIGNNVCWQCTHRKDLRPLWKRLLIPADESSYDCTFSQRTKVADPVSGLTRYIERVRGMLGPQLMLVDSPHPRCIEMNPDGKCQMFNIAMVKKKKHRKG